MLAQVSPTPTLNTGGWINVLALGSIIFGVIIVLIFVAGYLRYAPKFRRSAQEEPTVLRPGIPAPSVRVGEVAARAAVTAPAPAAVAAPAAAPPAAAPAAAAPAAAPAKTEQAAPAPEQHKGGPAELDQETFDRVLQEQLDKGTDRRVAEGRARAAAVVAARKKAGG